MGVMKKIYGACLFLSIAALGAGPILRGAPVPTRSNPASINEKAGELPLDLQRLDARFQPASENGSIAAPLKGIWRSHGYGYLYDLTGKDANVYIEAGNLCWHTDLGIDNAYYLNGKDEAIFTDGPGGTYYTYHRLAELPHACTANLPVTPGLVFDALWQAMNERYAFFRLRDIDWPARRKEYRPKALAAQNDEQLYQAVTGAISGFGDDHLTLRANVDGVKKSFRGPKQAETLLLDSIPVDKTTSSPSNRWGDWVKADQDTIAQELMGGHAHHALDGHMMWGMLNQHIGYIYINVMTDYGGGSTEKDAALVATEVDKALAEAAGADAMIVDITQNRGGDDRMGRTIASRFTDKKRLAYIKHVRGGTPQPFYLYPAGPRQFVKPVYLMTSVLTLSAADVFTLAMRALPNVIQIGQTTDGSFSDMLGTPLPNHWRLTFSNEIYLDPAGHLYEKAGITPQKVLQIFQPSDLAAGHVAAVRKVMELAGEKK